MAGDAQQRDVPQPLGPRSATHSPAAMFRTTGFVPLSPRAQLALMAVGKGAVPSRIAYNPTRAPR